MCRCLYICVLKEERNTNAIMSVFSRGGRGAGLWGPETEPLLHCTATWPREVL